MSGILAFILFVCISSAPSCIGCCGERFNDAPPPVEADSAEAPRGSPAVFAFVFVVFFFFAILLRRRLLRRRCYLLDFCCTGAEGNVCASEENFKFFLGTWRSVNEANLQFQFKVLRRSGVGEEAYAPPRLIERGEDSGLDDARLETENLLVTAARRLLRQTSVHPQRIDILVVNSSLFNPTPSLTSVLVHSLRLRPDVQSFNLAGMGCSAGLISVSLAEQLLRRRSQAAIALVVSTENITRNMYYGNDRSFMVSNCLFRCGCAAVLLTNRKRGGGGGAAEAKMELVRWVRTMTGGAEEAAYESVQHKEDDEGKVGVCLRLSLVEVAGRALRANVVALAPAMLPWIEIAKVALDAVWRRRAEAKVGTVASTPPPPAYAPDFKKAVNHFCIHPGGRAVLEAIGKGLKLSEYDMEPGKMALHRFGNTSSSGVWYAVAYCEAKRRLKRGDTVWQIALGSGFKCNSALWRVLRDIEPPASSSSSSSSTGVGLDSVETTSCNPWLPFIHRYPAAAANLRHLMPS